LRILARPRSLALLLALLVAGVAAALVATLAPVPAQASGAVPAAASSSAIAASRQSAHAALRARLVAEVGAEVPREIASARRSAVAAKHQAVRFRIVEVARKQIGDRYSAGSSGPSAFDCSGLVRYVYRVVTGKDLPHYSGAQYLRSDRISRKQAKPGDLVFFLRGGAHHVGIYIGNGRMIDAAGYGEGVRVSPISGSWWSRAYTGMGRLLPS
jgi:cell wall-associated NlpC family hydrolase